MQSRPRATIGLLLVVVAISVCARIVLALERPAWHDEIFTIWAARLPLQDLVSALRWDSGPPLFYLLERPFARAADSPGGDAFVRVLPLLASLALFGAAGTLPRGPARRWWIGLAACFALGNLYAAEARAYALLEVLCLGIFLLGVEGAESGRRLTGLFAIAATALWIHYLALIAVGVAAAFALVERRRRSLVVLSAALLAFSPWIPIFRAQPREAMAWLREPAAGALPAFLSGLGGVGRIPAPFGPPPSATLFIAGAAAGVALLVLVFPATKDDPPGRHAVLFVLIVLAVALLAPLWRPVAFAGRSETAVLAVWIWAIARAAPRRRPLAAIAALAGALGLVATVLVVSGPHPETTPSSAVERVARLARTGDVVLAGPSFYLPARLAADRGRLPARVVALPSTDAAHPGWFIAWPLKPGDVSDALRIAEAVPPGSRLFLLLPPAYDVPALTESLAQHGTLRELVRQNDGVLTVWTASRAPAPPAAAPAGHASSR